MHQFKVNSVRLICDSYFNVYFIISCLHSFLWSQFWSLLFKLKIFNFFVLLVINQTPVFFSYKSLLSDRVTYVMITGSVGFHLSLCKFTLCQ